MSMRLTELTINCKKSLRDCRAAGEDQADGSLAIAIARENLGQHEPTAGRHRLIIPHGSSSEYGTKAVRCGCEVHAISAVIKRIPIQHVYFVQWRTPASSYM
jgi:hypothetical protein